MYLTIVKPDNLVILDQRAHTIKLSDFNVPGNLHALQWKNTSGHIEYVNHPFETISQLPDWTEALIQEHQKISEEQDFEQEQNLRQAVYQNNGNARQQRNEQSRKTKVLKEQQAINRYVMEKMK